MMKMPQVNFLQARNFLPCDSYKIRIGGKSSTATFTSEQLAAKLRAALDAHSRFAAAPELPLSGGRLSSNVRADQAASWKKNEKSGL
jgi:hypothetical protein